MGVGTAVWLVARAVPSFWLGKIYFCLQIFVFLARISSKSFFFCAKTKSFNYLFLKLNNLQLKLNSSKKEIILYKTESNINKTNSNIILKTLIIDSSNSPTLESLLVLTSNSPTWNILGEWMNIKLNYT